MTISAALSKARRSPEIRAPRPLDKVKAKGSRSRLPKPCTTRIALIFWHAIVRAFAWMLSVALLAAFPIGLHQLTLMINKATSRTVSDAVVADAYLYLFIVAMAAFIDTSADERLRGGKFNLTMTFVLVAMTGAILYFAACIDVVDRGLQMPLSGACRGRLLPSLGLSI
jgi:cation transport ATPase